MVIGETAVHIEEQLGCLAVQLGDDAMHHRARDAVTGIKHHLHAAAEMKLRRDFIDIRSHHVGGLLRSGAAREIALLDDFAGKVDLR